MGQSLDKRRKIRKESNQKILRGNSKMRSASLDRSDVTRLNAGVVAA